MRPEDLPPPVTPADEVRRAAKEILARREFQEPPKTLYERVVEALSDALNELIETLFEGGRSAVVAWIALAVVIAVIGFLLWRVVGTMGSNARGTDEPVVTHQHRRPAVDWEREADEHAAAGRWREAVRCRYRAVVARLAASHVVDEIPGRTAGEYRAEVAAARPDVAAAFGEATVVFERAWYGFRATGPEEHDRVVAAGTAVTESVRR